MVKHQGSKQTSGVLLLRQNSFFCSLSEQYVVGAFRKHCVLRTVSLHYVVGAVCEKYVVEAVSVYYVKAEQLVCSMY